MINLLPPDIKESIVYARRNTSLRNWAVSLVVGIVGIYGIVGLGYFYMQNSINSYSSLVNKGSENLTQQNLEQTQNQVKDLSNNLKLVTQVLSREILFSRLIRQIGSALPNGSILSRLSIDKVEGGLNLQAIAKDYQTATQVQINLQDQDNKIFEKADILNVGCTPNSNDPTNLLASSYPCSIELRTLFAKNNNFTFFSDNSAEKKND